MLHESDFETSMSLSWSSSENEAVVGKKSRRCYYFRQSYRRNEWLVLKPANEYTPKPAYLRIWMTYGSTLHVGGQWLMDSAIFNSF
jgi:hypothetical protein